MKKEGSKWIGGRSLTLGWGLSRSMGKWFGSLLWCIRGKFLVELYYKIEEELEVDWEVCVYRRRQQYQRKNNTPKFWYIPLVIFSFIPSSNPQIYPSTKKSEILQVIISCLTIPPSTQVSNRPQHTSLTQMSRLQRWLFPQDHTQLIWKCALKTWRCGKLMSERTTAQSAVAKIPGERFGISKECLILTETWHKSICTM